MLLIGIYRLISALFLKKINASIAHRWLPLFTIFLTIDGSHVEKIGLLMAVHESIQFLTPS